MKIFNKTKQLFGIKEQDVPTPSVQPINKEMKQEGETYKQFGFRSAGLNVGSIFALSPSLHAVYLGLKKEQEKDIELQKELKRKQQTEITNKEAERQKCQNNLQDAQGKLQEIKESIEKKGKEIEKLESESHRRNRPAWIQLVISSVLLIPFTIYFFVFYSSVAYSAFFQDFDTSSIGNDGTVKISYAIFNSKALLQAWNDGFTEVMLILLMPFIFLVFGYFAVFLELLIGKAPDFEPHDPVMPHDQHGDLGPQEMEAVAGHRDGRGVPHGAPAAVRHLRPPGVHPVHGGEEAGAGAPAGGRREVEGRPA